MNALRYELEAVARRPLRLTEVAELLAQHPNTVRRIPPSELPFFRLGTRGDRRYELADVLRYKDERREDGRPRLVAP